MDNCNLEIIPGILEKEWEEVENKLEKVKSFAKSAHIDFIDGKFTDNTTYLEFENFKKFSDDIFLEAHLMVESSIEYLDKLAGAGFKRFIGHIEKMPSIEEFVAKGQLLGEVGIALDGPTEIGRLDGINLDDLDCILIYTSEKVGHTGPPMMTERLEKIKRLREKTNIPIEADGGIKDSSIKQTLEAGATRFVATSFIWETSNPSEAFKRLNGKINLS